MLVNPEILVLVVKGDNKVWSGESAYIQGNLKSINQLTPSPDQCAVLLLLILSVHYRVIGRLHLVPRPGWRVLLTDLDWLTLTYWPWLTDLDLLTLTDWPRLTDLDWPNSGNGVSAKNHDPKYWRNHFETVSTLTLLRSSFKK